MSTRTSVIASYHRVTSFLFKTKLYMKKTETLIISVNNDIQIS